MTETEAAPLVESTPPEQPQDPTPAPAKQHPDDQIDQDAKPRLPIVLIILFVLFFALFVVAIALAGVAGGSGLNGARTLADLSPNDYEYLNIPFQMPLPYVLAALGAGLLAIAVLTGYAVAVLREPTGNERMMEIATNIAHGSDRFLRTEYIALAPLVAVLFVLLGFAQNWRAAGCYAIGALLSGLTGYIGMRIATRGNVRTTAAAVGGLSKALNVAFRSGAVMGLAVVAFALSGISAVYLIFRDVRALAAFSAGASTVALFARVAGGIYTKAADVGADLVGKVESDIPEDDPRNPATIADNVGDNVGDVAGMGADLFESYVGSLVATAVLGASLPYFSENRLALCIYNHLHLDELCPTTPTQLGSIAADVCSDDRIRSTYPSIDDVWASNTVFIALPFMLALVGILVSVICTVYVHVSKNINTEQDNAKVMESLLTSLRINIYIAAVLVIAGAAGLCWGLFGESSAFLQDSAFGAKVSVVNVAETCPVNNEGFILISDADIVESDYLPTDPLGFEFPSPDEVPWRLFVCILIGLVLGNLIGALTEYFTAGAYAPTKGIGSSGEYGAGAVVIQGLGVGLLSTGIPLVLVATSIVGAFELFGTYGVALAAVGMLSTLGVTMATDAYGPVADNAGGIAEMAELDSSVRDTTDALDALGNTTAATGKGFSNGSAVLTAFALLTALVQDSGLAPSPQQLVPEGPNSSVPLAGEGVLATIRDYDEISLVDVFIVFSVLVGVCLPYIFGALTMLAVSRAAQAMIVEVRRQFRDIDGLREGRPGVKPEHVRCIQISTVSSIREMVLPGAIAIMAPLIVGFGFGQKALIALLLSAIASGYMMGIMMSNAGGAWDNAKKLVESGFFGKANAKGSDWHKATVAGDTVGDPFKDTSGPSMNILIKLMTTFGLVTVSLMQPERDNGWIGAILLGATAIFCVGFAVINAKLGEKTRKEATRT
eukprot:GFKZ01001384.1.p1 GENE.GFKZ01001384.1~~GFKZ01001384.1.p1  ORF type:complete len:949 (-),score=155.07 GFKZ01001384.1:1515-4361(-)